MNREINTVIFDFDGTIADSFHIFIETLEEVLKLPQPLTPAEIEDLRGSSTRGILQKLGVKKRQMPSLVIKGRRGIADKMDRVDIFDGMPEAIAQLAKENYQLFIVSTNNNDLISGFLHRYRLEGNIASVYAGTSIFGKAKRLSTLLKKEELLAGQCIYIGDETRDIEAAREVNMKCVAVEWGYSSRSALKSYNPYILVATPANLVKAINSLS
jgi:phosphoglycolate phosphatase